MPHSCGEVPATTLQLSTGDLLVMGNQYFWWASKICSELWGFEINEES
jgi:hypothetical protein